MNNVAQKLQKCWTHKIVFNIISKMLRQPCFFHSQSSTLPKDAPAKFYPSKAFGLSFTISSVAPTRSSTFYSYLITRIGSGNLNDVHTIAKAFVEFGHETSYTESSYHAEFKT